MIVGFTGTQEGMRFEQFAAFGVLLLELAPSVFVHGCCVGSDEEAHWEVRRVVPDALIRVFPGLDGHGESPELAGACLRDADLVEAAAPYLKRNGTIAHACDVLVATPYEFRETLSGTWSTVRRARKAGTPVIVVWPDGRLERVPSA